MIIKLLKRIVNSEGGQALPVVLAFLVFGGLLIVPSVNFVSTNLNSVRVINSGTKGVYAAEAGAEYIMWRLKKGLSVSPNTPLDGNINGLAVSMQTTSLETRTVYMDQLVDTGQHPDWLSVVTGDIVWDAGAQAYKYTITVTWRAEQGAERIFLSEVGARLPVGYSYKNDSADDFLDNLSLANPEQPIAEDAHGAQMPRWEFGTPRPDVRNPEMGGPLQRTQSFYITYITGSGSLEGDYAWLVSPSIGTVGELTGDLYQITATATRPGGGEVARVVADVMKTTGGVEILSWQVK